jgi:hypothetical protein
MSIERIARAEYYQSNGIEWLSLNGFTSYRVWNWIVDNELRKDAE